MRPPPNEPASRWSLLLMLATAAACGAGLASLFARSRSGYSPVYVRSDGYYVHPSENSFLKYAKAAVTDKVTKHSYEFIYSKYFEMIGKRNSVAKLLEIGLGCNMEYGPGHSAGMWRKYMPQAEIWMAEYDAACVSKHKKALDDMGVRVMVGDQADIKTLRGWVQQAGKHAFDVIIDDGGHSNMQMYNSFMVLFFDALKPGGVYIIEDLQCARIGKFIDGDRKHVFNEVIRDWIEALAIDGAVEDQDPVLGYKPKWKIPPQIKSIECSSGACTITKCYDDDGRCIYPFTDTTLPGLVLNP